MKLIKKIVAIMLAVMMVLGMASVVSAEETTTSGKYNDGNGTITIENAIEGQTYTIYRILKLESFSKTDTTGNYAYKLEERWSDFIGESKPGNAYLTKDNNDYITWKAGANVVEFAKVALKYAKDNSINTAAQVTADSTKKVTFSNLPLGYYVVDSSAGTLCSLNTTAKDVTIQEKNGVPSVEKKIDIGSDGTENLVEKNSVNLGDTILFKTTINVKPGAEKYVLHDKMNSNLENLSILHIYDNKNDNYNYVDKANIEIVYSTDINDGCTFEIKFLDKFYQDRAELINKGEITSITVQYAARVKSDAPIKTAMENKTWLTYGENNTKSNESVTNTYTFGIPVFKYTGTNQALEGAIFKLYTDVSCNNDEKALKFQKNNDGKYRYIPTSVEGGGLTLTSPNNGYINIEGIKEGIYYLKEIEAPKGYNKLKEPIKIVIDENGNITVNGQTTSVTEVKVQNNTGTILPSTGGNGTSLIYFLGAVLALVSGVVLITKQRMKNS